MNGLYDMLWDEKLRKKDISYKLNKRGKEALKLVESGERMLDVGCGEGIFCYYAKEKYDEVYGIDISQSVINFAQKFGIRLFKMDVDEGIFFENEFFDCVTCLDVIEHVKEPRFLISEISRVLKRGGILVLTTPNFLQLRFILYLILKKKFPKTSSAKTHEILWDGGHIHYFTLKDIEELLEQNNFKIEYKKGGWFDDMIIVKARKNE